MIAAARRLQPARGMFGLSRPVEVALAVGSVAMFVGTLVAVSVFVVRIPADFFVRPQPKRSLLVRVLMTGAGVALLALGVLMLVLPGQGVLTILIGLSILGLARRRLIRRLLSLPRVLHATNRMRARYGRPPLIVPGPHEDLA